MRKLSLSALWLALPFVGAIVGASAKPIPPQDYWWHLAMGRLVANGTFPDANYFLYTLPADLPFTNQPWLGQLLMWWGYDLGGPAVSLVTRSFILAVTFGLLIWAVMRRGASARVVGGIGMLAVLLALPVLTVRTRMFALLPFVATLAICQEVTDGRWSPWALAVLAPLTAFWANVHGSFVLAPIILGAYAVGETVDAFLRGSLDTRRLSGWAVALVAVGASAALTPLGVDVYGYVLQLTVQSSVAGTVTEWQPPDVSELHGALVLMTAAAGTAFLAWKRRSISTADALLFGGTLILGASAVRGIFWWSAVVPLVMAPAISRAFPQEEADAGEREPVFVAVALVALTTMLLAVQPGLGHRAFFEAAQPAKVRRTDPGAWVMSNESAFGALTMAANDSRKRLFHDQAIGGMVEVFFTTAEQPAQVAFVDQRMEFVPDEVWDRYFEVSDGKPGWEAELGKHGVDTLVLSPAHQAGLVQAALLSERWHLVFVDEAQVMFYASLDGTKHPPEQREAEGEERNVHDGDDPEPTPR